MIEVHGLSVSKNGRTICRVAELEIAAGERVAILGPNGSGKTTLLRVLSELELEYHGRLRIGAPRKDRIYVHQSPYLFRGTVLSNVMYGLRLRERNQAKRQRLAHHWLDRFGLRKLSKRCPTHLSGGERKRVAMARAMVLTPRLLLLDEPLADMDRNGAAAMLAAIDESKQCTVLVSSPLPLRAGLTTREYQMEAPNEPL